MLEKLPLPDSNGPLWALFLDVDGTLLELADHPDDVVVPEDLPGLLRQFQQLLGGAFALVSGRSLLALDTMFGSLGLDAAGCHGAEYRSGGRESILVDSGIAVGMFANELINETHRLRNVFVEIKPQSVVLHFRPSCVAPRDALSAMERAMEHACGDFRILEGKNVFEAVGRNTGKDVAVARFLRERPYQNRIPVFIGDDTTDEAAFHEVNRRTGMSIRVGNHRDTAAQYEIPNVAMMATWMRESLLPRLSQVVPIASMQRSIRPL